MTKTKVILGISLAVLFAVSAVAMSFQEIEAAKVKKSTNVLQETYDLSEFPGPEVVVLMDTTNVADIERGHVVATLPNEDGTCTEGESPHPTLAIAVGAADNTSGDDLADLVTLLLKILE